MLDFRRKNFTLSFWLLLGAVSLCSRALLAEEGSKSGWMEENDELVYIDPHAAVLAYSKIFKETTRTQNLDLWLRTATKLNSAYFHIGDLDKVPEILAIVLPEVEKANRPELHAQLLIQQYAIQAGRGEKIQAAGLLQKAWDLAHQSENPVIQALVLIYRARAVFQLGHSGQAIDLLHEALVSLKKAPRDARYLAMMHNIAQALHEYAGQNTSESIHIFGEITELIDRRGLHFLGTIAYENYGNVMLKENRLEEALASFAKSIKHAEKIDDEIGIASASLGLGTIYRNQKKYAKAQQQYAVARPTFVKYKDKHTLITLDLLEAEVALLMGQSESALNLLQNLRGDFETLASPQDRATFLKLEAEALENLSRYRESQQSYKNLSVLQRELYDSKNQELSNRYYAEFEVERRNQKNLSLEHENRLQSIELTNQTKLTRATRLALSMAIFSLGILGLSFYRAYRQKRKIEGLQQYIEKNVLQRFLPPEMVQEILIGKSRLDDRTKTEQVTILFADLCQFTRATDRLGPETISHILNDFFVNMTDVIFSEGGTIDKFIGDAIMVIFGAPSSKPLEEQAHAAVRCALKMQQKLVELNKVWELSEGQHFEMRIGIHQGHAVVGTFGGAKRSDYTVVGTSVNIAARVEGIADPNSVLVTDAIIRFLQPSEYELRGSFRLRGLETEIPLYTIKQDHGIQIVSQAS